MRIEAKIETSQDALGTKYFCPFCGYAPSRMIFLKGWALAHHLKKLVREHSCPKREGKK